MTATMDRPTTGQVEALRRIGVDVPDGMTRDEAGRKLADAVQAARAIDPMKVSRDPLTGEARERIEAWASFCPACRKPMGRSSDGQFFACFDNTDCPAPASVFFGR